MCPHCGFNFAADTPLTVGPWTLWPRYATLAGNDMGLTPAECGVLYTLAKAGGEWVKADAILNRVSDSENVNIISVFVCRIRKKLGEHSPINGNANRKNGCGYRWVTAQ